MDKGYGILYGVSEGAYLVINCMLKKNGVRRGKYLVAYKDSVQVCFCFHGKLFLLLFGH